MSKDKIHIDKLFNQLKGKTYPTDPAGFDDIQNKLTDQAWAGKFKDYKHSNIPSFNSLPMAVVDNNRGGNRAKGIILSIIAILFLGSGILVGTYFYKNKEKGNINTKNSVLTQKNMVEVATINNEELINSVAETKTESDNNAVKQVFSKSNIPEKSISPLKYSQVKTNKNQEPVNNANKTFSNKSNNDNENSIEKPFIDDKIIDNTNSVENEILNNAKQFNSKNINLGNEEFSNFRGQVGINPLLNINLMARKNLVNITKKLDIVSSKAETKNNKVKIPFTPYLAFGLGLQSAQKQFTNTQGIETGTYEILIGAEKRKINFYTGFSASEYSFLSTQKRINIYDSFPHKNANGDTIGWFRKNFRDTILGSNDRNKIKTTSIPIHFQFKVLQYKRFDLAVGAGFNFNYYKQAQIFGRDDKNYSVVYSASSPIIKRANITAGFNTRMGYRITPFTALYLKVETFTGQNISKINTFDIKPNGANIKIGLQRFIR